MPTPKNYDTDNRYYDLYQLYNEQKFNEYFTQLTIIANENNPWALAQLAQYYFYQSEFEEPFPIAENKPYAQALMQRCIDVLEQDEALGNGEASRILGYVHCGLIGIESPNLDKAEYHLLKALELEQYLAANDLVTFYRYTDKAKAHHYYDIAVQHGVCILTSPDTNQGQMTLPVEASSA